MTQDKIDMLHGPLVGKLVRFALPLAAASMLQQLFNSCDIAVVGQFEGRISQAAVGASAPLINLMVSLFTGISLGLNVCIASYLGSGEREKLSEAEHTGITLSVVCGIIVIVLGELFSGTLLMMMNTPAEVMGDATTYLRIFFWAIAFQLVYDFAASVLRGSGDSQRPMYVLASSSVINLIFDILLVGPCGLGIAGAAYGTVIANAWSALATLWLLRKEKGEIHLQPSQLRLSGNYVREIFAIGLPAGIQGALFSASNIIIQAGINSFGATILDGNTAGMNFEMYTYFIVNAFGQAATTFTGANAAARNAERCRAIFRYAALIGISCSLVVGVIFYIFRAQFILIFTAEAVVIPYGFLRMTYGELLNWLTGTYEISGGCLRGMKYSSIPTIITALGCCVLRIIWVFGIMPAFGLNSFPDLLLIYPISWAITGVAMNLIYFWIRKREFDRWAAAKPQLA